MSAILAAILDFSKIFFFAKLQQILLELVRKHVFLASNTKIIENRVKKRRIYNKFSQNFVIFYFQL